MSIKTIRVCDGCGAELQSNSDGYNISTIRLESRRYTDAAGDTDSHVLNLEFCVRCAKDIKRTIEKIEGKTEEESKKNTSTQTSERRWNDD